MDKNTAEHDSLLKEAARLRMAGIAVLALGLVGACVFYWMESRAAAQAIGELSGYSQHDTRQVGIMMGTFGVMMLGWSQALERPGTEALLIAVVSVIVAWGCFRVAAGLDAGNSH